MIRDILKRPFRPGDFIVFRKPKRSTSPGPRAQHVSPCRFGEEYVYEVEKYWLVERVDDGQMTVVTRRGKRHQLDCDDQRLRRARWWERLLLRGRFPDPDQSRAPQSGAN